MIMKNNIVKNIILYLIFPIIFILLSCDITDSNKKNQADSTGVDTTNHEIIEKVFDNKMVVYRNHGPKFYIVDTESYQVIQEVNLPVPPNLNVYDILLSTNKDYIIYCCAKNYAPFDNYFVSYDILGDSIFTHFKTGLDSIGAPRMIPAFKPAAPGLFYLYTHKVGLYEIDFLEETIRTISTEKQYPKELYYSKDKKWIALYKYLPQNDHTELQLYRSEIGLDNVQYILNINDQDSINVKDMVFSEDNKYLFISFLLSQRRAVFETAFFGSYNLETKELTEHRIILPWSTNPYYIAYNSKRNECYMVGRQNKFYVIDVSSEQYTIKEIIELSGKIDGPSEILIHPNEDIAFVSCANSDFVVVVDLIKNTVITKIELGHPVEMFFMYK